MSLRFLTSVGFGGSTANVSYRCFLFLAFMLGHFLGFTLIYWTLCFARRLDILVGWLKFPVSPISLLTQVSETLFALERLICFRSCWWFNDGRLVVWNMLNYISIQQLDDDPYSAYSWDSWSYFFRGLKPPTSSLFNVAGERGTTTTGRKSWQQGGSGSLMLSFLARNGTTPAVYIRSGGHHESHLISRRRGTTLLTPFWNLDAGHMGWTSEAFLDQESVYFKVGDRVKEVVDHQKRLTEFESKVCNLPPIGAPWSPSRSLRETILLEPPNATAVHGEHQG